MDYLGAPSRRRGSPFEVDWASKVAAAGAGTTQSSRKMLNAFVGICAAMALVFGLTSPAQAAVRTIRDPKSDAPIDRYDMVRVRFNNGDHRLSVRVKATADLRRGRGYLVFHFSPSHGFRFYFEATSRRTVDGVRHNRLVLYSRNGSTPFRCRVRAHWEYVTDTVALSVPRSCVSDEISGPLWMTASLGPSRIPMTQDFINYDRWPKVRQG